MKKAETWVYFGIIILHSIFVLFLSYCYLSAMIRIFKEEDWTTGGMLCKWKTDGMVMLMHMYDQLVNQTEKTKTYGLQFELRVSDIFRKGSGICAPV